jgi:hypothetical protein
VPNGLIAPSLLVLDQTHGAEASPALRLEENFTGDGRSLVVEAFVVVISAGPIGFVFKTSQEEGGPHLREARLPSTLP